MVQIKKEIDYEEYSNEITEDLQNQIQNDITSSSSAVLSSSEFINNVTIKEEIHSNYDENLMMNYDNKNYTVDEINNTNLLSNDRNEMELCHQNENVDHVSDLQLQFQNVSEETGKEIDKSTEIAKNLNSSLDSPFTFKKIVLKNVDNNEAKEENSNNHEIKSNDQLEATSKYLI